MYELILTGILGFLGITIVDRVWFLIDYKKAEKGLEVLEHYHYGIALMGAAVVLAPFMSLFITYAMLGAGTAFIYHESKQKNFFAYTSSHFRGSATIGLILAAISIFSYFYLPTILR